MDEIRGEEGWISLGPWGRTNDGRDWAYMPEGPIMHITISHDQTMIRSILFESKSYDGIFGSSAKIGSCATIHDVIRTGKISYEEEWISLGPWGGKDGVDWAYKPNGPVMQISICYGEAIHSILFQTRSSDGFVISSEQIGSTGGNLIKTFCIDSSIEQLWSISLTYGDYQGQVAITSLCLETNIGNKYGPFGSGSGASSLSIPIEGGIIVGFHGRGGIGTYLTAIGIFVVSKVNNLPSSEKNFDSLHSVQEPDYAPTRPKGKISNEQGWMSLGPWGGKDGADWAYEVDGPIMHISIGYGKAINSILFKSKNYDGIVIGSSGKIGCINGHVTETFCIDTSEEQFTSISLTYDYSHGKVRIKTLCFNTNLNKYGPFGSGSDHYSESIPIEGGVFGGFHGRTDGRYITAIGVFVAPRVHSLHSLQDPDSAPIQLKVLGSGVGSKPKTVETPTIKSKWSSRFLVANFKTNFCASNVQVLGSGVGSKPKTLETPTIKSKWSSRFLVANFKTNFCASSSATTNKDDHHGGAPSPSSEMIPLATNKDDHHCGAPSPSSEMIPLATNKDDHHGGALSPTSKMIHSDLILLNTAVAEAEESIHHMKEKINQAHKKFKELQILPSSERDSEKLQKANSDKKELRKAIAKLKVHIRSYNKIRSADSNPHHKNWDNINGAEDGMTHFFHKEPEVAHTGEFDGLLKDFRDLPEPLRCCLSCFFKFPPVATIKRTPLIYLWIGQGYISEYLHSEGYVWDVEVHAGKIFDELIAKGFIEPIYQNCSLVPDSCTMSLSVRSSLYEEAKLRGFTSNGTFDLDHASVGSLIRQSSCLINVGEAIINFNPEILENMKHIRSLYLGRWQSSDTHHIELANAKILHGLNKLNSLTFLSLQGISMITELPTFISELKDLMILDLRACYNLEVIPDKIGLLKSLTHLDMSECYSLENMPKSLAQLSNLQILKGFLIGDFNNNKESCTLHDLSGLQKLRKLNIHISVKDLLSMQDLECLERFEGLKKLTISWGRLQARAEVITEAFQFATLPPRLQKLNLECFPMTSLTNWLMPSKVKELKKLYIRGGQLRDLGEIQKHQAERLTVEILQLKHLSNLELHWRELRTLFPKLIYLHQVECPKFFHFQGNERGMWMDHKAIDTHVQLQQYVKTCGEINSSSMLGSGSTSTQDNCNIL
ncbi:hypothetical protein RHMOL_Rhmol12G0050100 [Rhododendron molle]|uniref:Uncharacterized protein n=1 Tax=Rhododendron molle TaxID=49168 RepID=A0ACC0LEQ6_RHOML|nr:hypothetical protein RHMOL_Rhmol12G0050100 [Rhododendron molle]